MVVRMLKLFRGKMDDPSENLNIISIKEIISIENDIEAINKNQSDIKITISEMNSLE